MRKKQFIASNFPVTNRDASTIRLDKHESQCYYNRNKKKGVNFMLNMVNMDKEYGRSLTPCVFVV